VIHELAHINQEYGNFHIRHDRLLAPIRPLRIKMSQEYRMNWLVDGIADYVRFAYFEKKLGIDEKEFTRLRFKGYRKGYGITAAFLLWLEFTKDNDIVRKLDEKLEQRRYTSRIFKRNCGASLDHLWEEFCQDVAAQRWPTHPAA
jgi:hypothetical protein